MPGAGGTEVGRVSVRVVPDLDGFREKIRKELEEVENMEAQVKVTIDLTEFKAQIEEIKALLKSISDETVNVKIDKDSGVQKIQDGLKGAASEAEKLGKKLKNSLGDGDTERRVSRFASVLEGFGNFMQRAAGQASDLASKVGGELSSSARSFGSSLVQMIVQLVIWIPLLSAAAAGITYLIGVIAAALGGLPALLFGLGAPIAAAILGFDGIKKALEPLKDDLDALKTRLSNTFSKDLAPAVKNLSTLFPILSDGLNQAAEGLSSFFNEFTKSLTAKENIDNLKTAFAGVKGFLSELQPGVSAFFSSFLKASAVTGALEEMGSTLSNVLFKFKGFFDQSVADGSLSQGLKNLNKTLYSITGLFTALLRQSLKFFNGAAPGVNKFFDSLSGFFLRIDFEKLGKAFGTALERVGDAIDQIPPQTIDSITDSFVSLSDAVADIFDGKSFDVLISAFQLFLDIITGVAHAVDGFLETLAHIGDFIAGIPDWFGDLFDKGGELISGLWDGAKTKFGEFQDWVKSIPGKIGEFFSGAGSWLLQKGQDIVNGIRDGAVTAFNNVVAFFQSIPGRIRAFFSGAINWLVETGRNIINGLGNGISGAWLVVQMTFASVKNRVIAFFYGAGSWLLDAGHKIISGLVSGIRSAIPSITSILGTVTRLIPSWKGPAEKDKMLLFNNGQLIMQGLGRGLTSGFRPVQSLLGDMTTDIGNAFGSSLANDMQVSGADIAAVGTSQLTVAGTVDNGLTDAVAAALSGWAVQLDETGMARLVNKGQQKLGRRG